MNREEAQRLLDACTLRPSDAPAEAHALAEQDEALGAWLKQRKTVDQQVYDTLQTASPKADVPADLLRAMNAAAAQARRPVYAKPALWWAVAAAISLMATGAWLLKPEKLNWQAEALAQVQQIDNGDLEIDMASQELADLHSELGKSQCPLPMTLPAGFTKLGPLACKVIKVAGKPASVVCYRIDDEHEAHLVVMNAASLPNAPPQNHPAFVEKDGWHLAVWSEGDKSYMLATQAEPEKLKALFAAVPRPNAIANELRVARLEPLFQELLGRI